MKRRLALWPSLLITLLAATVTVAAAADEPTRSVLTGSIAFSTQANKLLGGDVLTVDDAIEQLGGAA